MFTRRLSLVLGIFSISLMAAPAFAQTTGTDPQSKPRKVKAEPARAFKEWIVGVEPIILPEVRAACKKLQTDNERENFIGEFWHLRDPDPDTAENEYRDGYYERLAYV